MTGFSKVTNLIAPKPGDTHWLDEIGIPVHEIIAVHGTRAFCTLRKKASRPGQPDVITDPTVQVWSRWSVAPAPPKQYLIEIRPAKVGDKLLGKASINGPWITAEAHFPTERPQLIVLCEGSGFDPKTVSATRPDNWWEKIDWSGQIRNSFLTSD